MRGSHGRTGSWSVRSDSLDPPLAPSRCPKASKQTGRQLANTTCRIAAQRIPKRVHAESVYGQHKTCWYIDVCPTVEPRRREASP